ncbi:MAG: hypothetical protein GY843_11720 [Neptuniibacter sp.]|nr:hypothetical protein [Neptuniibacter sp.]
MTKYYYHGGKRVAMRVDESGESEVYYLHGDHLGSTSLTTDENGAMVARQLYHPYGTTRYSEGTLATDFGFTGQRNVAGIGLMDYNARFYHPYLNRFISADTIVPDPGNPQSFNRYAYVNNRPLNYVDPSGHAEESAGDDDPDFYWFWYYYSTPEAYYTDYMAWLDGQISDSLRAAWRYQENELGTDRALDDNIAPLMEARYQAEIARPRDEIDREVLLSTAPMIASQDPNTIRYLDTTVKVIGSIMYEVGNTAFAKMEGGLAVDQCFEAGTPIVTMQGSIPIETVKVGDLVLAVSSETATIGYYTVTDVFSRSVNSLLEIVIGNDSVHVTEEHPFWVIGKGWINAENLNPGDCVQTLTGVCQTVVEVQLVAISSQVYNFTVAEAHTYFAGDGQWLVHNQCGGYYRGTGKPWTSGATPNSAYTQFDPRTGNSIQTAIYDSNGNVIVHIDWKQHGSAPPGHWHFFTQPGNPATGHYPGAPHYGPIDTSTWGLPSDWDVSP